MTHVKPAPHSEGLLRSLPANRWQAYRLVITSDHRRRRHRHSRRHRRTTTAAATARLVLRLVDLERTTAHVLAVQALNGARRIGARHFHEAEAARTTGVAVHDQRYRLDRAVLREQRANRGLRRRKRADCPRKSCSLKKTFGKTCVARSFETKEQVEETTTSAPVTALLSPLIGHLDREDSAFANLVVSCRTTQTGREEKRNIHEEKITNGPQYTRMSR